MSDNLTRPRLSVKTPPSILPEVDENETPAALLVSPQKTRDTAPVFMVFGEGGESPSVRHRSRGMAQREAMRLALLNPGARFHVLQSWRCYASAEA